MSMSASTNSLVAKAKRFGFPLGAVAALLLSVPFIVCHQRVNAASYGTPLDDNSVSSLVSLDNAVEAVAARVTPAVVNVAVTSRGSSERMTEDDQDSGQGQGQMQGMPPGFSQFGPGGPMGQIPQQPQIEHGIGSGIIISPDGYIVTNNHVVDGAVQVRVTLHDRRVLTGKVIGTDKLTDLAVIKVDGHDLPTIAWGDSTKLH